MHVEIVTTGNEAGSGRARGVRAAVGLVLGLATFGPVAAAAAPRFGVDLGANFSRLDYDESLSWWTDEGWRVSITGGASMEVPLGGRFGLATGYRYLRMGNRVTFDAGEPLRQAGVFTIAQDYFTFPVLLTMRPRRPDALVLSIGPELGFLVAGALDYERTVYGAVDPIQVEDVVDLRDELEPVVLLGTAAVGWEFPGGAVDWCLQMRSTFGLTRASREFYWSSGWRTIGIETTAGLRW